MDIVKEIQPNEIFSAKGSVIVITGGGSGIGLAMASITSKAGAIKVYILGRRHDRLSAAAQLLKSSEANVIPIVCDVTSQSSIDAAVSFIEKDTGYIDVLINNAGRPSPHYNPTTAETIEELRDGLLKAHEETQDVLQTNTASIIGVSSSFLLLLHKGNLRRGWPKTRLSADGLNKQQRNKSSDGNTDDIRTSQIITVSSIAGFERHGITGLAYTASKTAATHLGKVLATILVPWNIRSNVIVPGFYPSEMTSIPQMGKVTVSNTPAGRFGATEDVAGVLLYLIGRAGAFVNGGTMLTDGGRISIEPSSW
ncbi:hypothetical protein F5X99DRAFT_392536 [Biscogniauxia marginata]|nr:hypothetical protein F5X99DRAFT_392536 [Biscogniauxia marginata]